MRYLLIAALLAVGIALVAVIQVVNVPTAQGQVRIDIGIPVPVPYFYSPDPCPGCWYGEWEGRRGYHRGGGRPWEQQHDEGRHYGRDGGDRHEGHGGGHDERGGGRR